MLINYAPSKAGKLEIRLKRQKKTYMVQFFDGMRIDPKTVPECLHVYHTRHSDTDCSQPVTIAPEGVGILVNFCGTIVSEEKIEVSEETKLMYVSWL